MGCWAFHPWILAIGPLRGFSHVFSEGVAEIGLTPLSAILTSTVTWVDFLLSVWKNEARRMCVWHAAG